LDDDAGTTARYGTGRSFEHIHITANAMQRNAGAQPPSDPPATATLNTGLTWLSIDPLRASLDNVTE
jgi:hypothetical protein